RAAGLAVTLREAVRRGVEAATGATAQAASGIAALLRQPGPRRRFVVFHFIAFTGLGIQGWALFYWLAEFFIREHGATRAGVGLTYGTIALTVGTLGSVVAGLLSARMMK